MSKNKAWQYNNNIHSRNVEKSKIIYIYIFKMRL